MEIPVIPHNDVFVIGDVHGCAGELDALLQKLPLTRDSALVLVGDYVDRGPSSRQVIDTVLEIRKRVDVFPLLGNHESLFLEFLSDPKPVNAARFIYNGGGATLQSYAEVPGKYRVPDDHLQFLNGLKLAYQCERHVIVHAGLPNVGLEALDEDEHRDTLLWVRGAFHRSTFAWSKTVVHGHSRVPRVYIDDRRINIDTGCVYNNTLSAIHLRTRQIFQVERRATSVHEFLRDHPDSRRKAVRFDGQVDVAVTKPRGLPMFVTLNYNDFGVLLRCARDPAKRLLEMDQEVEGTIFPNDSYFQVRFEGVVVRVEDTGSEFRYGVKFKTPPTQVG